MAEYLQYFLNYALDTYKQVYDNLIFAGDFSLNEPDPTLSEFL